MTEVSFRLLEDGEHFEWQHDCLNTRAVAQLPKGTRWWTVDQEEPLTVSPSLLCRRCGCHGFIRDGKWIEV